MSLFARLRHLAGRFFGVLRARVDPGELMILDRYFSPAERDLFLSMRVADQRHSLDLFHRLERDGHGDPDLLRAALLHDVGKAAGLLPLPYRVIFALCRLTSPELARRVGNRDRPWLMRPFYLAAHHADIGARAAAQAGCNQRVVHLICRHDAPDDDLSRVLHQYDGQM